MKDTVNFKREVTMNEAMFNAGVLTGVFNLSKLVYLIIKPKLTTQKGDNV